MQSYLNVKSNYQAAVMVPTEILATQHYKFFKEIFKNENIK
jgi:ATP-dependent DNA helicase RecG